jgi:WD40 repeat protein
MRSLFQIAPQLSWSILFLVAAPGYATEVIPDFHTDIAPILRDYCAGCHSGKELEGDLSVETFASLKKGGENGNPLEGKNGHAAMLGRVLRGEKPKMPPSKEPQPTQTEIKLVEAWLSAGAPGPKGEDVSILSMLNIPDLPISGKESKIITALAFTLDGKKVARAKYKSVEVIDEGTRQVLAKLDGHEGKVTAIQFSPDCKTLAVASGVPGVRGGITLWSIQTDAVSRADFSTDHRDLICSLRWSPDGRTLASGGYDSKIILWDPAAGKAVRTLSGHNGAIFDLAFSPDGTLLASASGDQTTKIWRVRDGLRLDTLKEPQGEQFCVAFMPDGSKVLSAGADNRLRIWDLKSRDQVEINPIIETRFAHEAGVTGMALNSKGDRLLTVSLDRSTKLWSVPHLNLLGVQDISSDTPSALAPVPNTQDIIVARMDGSVKRISFEATDQKEATALKHDSKPTAAETVNSRAQSELLANLNTSLQPDQPVEKISEIEPNDAAQSAMAIHFPAEIKGCIERSGDVDHFSFDSEKGQSWFFEVTASRAGSKLDSKLEVLSSNGDPVERAVLQAVRSSWLTFRGKDSNTSDDFRIQHFREMEINEFLYCNGEIVKLWMYPRGPDSGFLVYPGTGMRHAYFDTTPAAHPLGETVYVVNALPPGSQPPANGLPVFRLNYENDDASNRRAGSDSILSFTAPSQGRFVLRISDARGFGGNDSPYTLHARTAKPDFQLKIPAGKSPSVSPGSGREFTVAVDRIDGFDGPVTVSCVNLPQGFHASSPIVIEEGQDQAFGVIWTDADAAAPSEEASNNVKLTATAAIRGRTISHEMSLGQVKLGAAAKVLVRIEPEGNSGSSSTDKTGPLEFTIRPGETLTAKVHATRVDFKDRIDLGKEDSGRNLPHGVYVDNVGLNGLLIVESETERSFTLQASKWVPESSRWIFLRAKPDGGQASQPVLLHVKR